MEYNFLKREVYMPEKHYKRNRTIKLGKYANIFFAVLWFSKGHKAKYEEIFNRVYGYSQLDKKLLRNMAILIRRKGIDIRYVYKYGYRLNDKK